MKQEYIQIRLTEKEKKKLKQNADKLGMSISQFIRTQCVYKNFK